MRTLSDIVPADFKAKVEQEMLQARMRAYELASDLGQEVEMTYDCMAEGCTVQVPTHNGSLASWCMEPQPDGANHRQIEVRRRAIARDERRSAAAQNDRRQQMAALSGDELVRPSLVDHPRHYNTGTIEVIDAIEDWQLDFHLGNAVKYIARANHKGDPLVDLEKAKWYIERRIAQLADGE